MSTPPTTHADEWLDQKLTTARRRFHQNRQLVSETIAKHPIGAVAAGIGLGYIARRLPLASLTAAAVRLSLGSLPHALLVVGAARTWQLLRTPPAPRVPVGNRGDWLPAESCIAISNRLLTGELAAQALCSRALEQLSGDQPRADLQHVVAVHQDNAARLRDLVTTLGGVPASPAPAPSADAHASAETPWSMLQELEQLNLRQIEEVIGNPKLATDLRQLLQHHLLPRTKENMGTLLRAEGHSRPTV